MATDPVCEMQVDERSADFTSQYGSETFYFCSEQCKAEFESRPEHYATAA
jgi:YHS domain-containing protein